MTLIGLRRLLAGFAAPLSVVGVMQRNPINGRQDKAGCPAAGVMRLKACLHVVS
jgi:hypothetical protein